MRVGRLTRGYMLGLLCCACSGVIEQPGQGEGKPGSHPSPAADGGETWRPNQYPAADAAATQPPAATLSRRLSRAELDHTLADLLGDTSAPATRLLPEDPYSPYDNDIAGQIASSAYIDSLSLLATDVAERALADDDARAQLVPCTPRSQSDEDCFRQVVARLLPRALRRPIADSELAPYLTLLRVANEPEQTARPGFDMALSLLIQAVLLDPELLYRIETSGTRALNDHEIAARLSYLLWGTMPDQALLADAAAGRLSTISDRKQVFERMWQDPRTRQQIARFHALWLGYRALPHEAQLTAAFARETSALIERVIFDDAQSYLELFRSPETYLDQSLAEHYGLPAPAQSAEWVRYPDDSGRAGILSHGSVLSAFGKFSDTSPTQRGIFVRTRLMCQPIPPPPPTVTADKPPAGADDAECKIDRYSQHRSDSACAGCHALTDAIGFGLERFDNAGRYRTHDEGLTQCTISGTGELAGIGDFSGPKELAALLVENDLLSPCVVEQFVHFALGRAPSSAESARLLQQFRANDHSFASMVESFVTSDAFVQHTEEP
jgi:hypothetical protein